jgi:WhiB family redox-sensing transcriptional regulator
MTIDPADDDSGMWTAPADRYDLPTFTSAGSQVWRADAACRGMGADVFLPGPGQNSAVAAAKAICNRCPVKSECLTEALTDPDNSGIWAATSQRQRKAIRAESGAPRKRPKPIQHGTRGGHETHARRGEPSCTPCRLAYNAHHAAQQTRRRALARTITATHTDKAAA